jgi:UDP-N-acetylmuramate dehydrogenase
MIYYNLSLKPYNTFGIDVTAKEFATFSSIDELEEILIGRRSAVDGRLVLGGGSNILFTKNFDGIVLKNEWKGIELLKEDNDYYYVKAYAGEVWHKFVLYCIQHNYAGVENLSLIPGTVGASPMQNIGAYGIEIKDVFYELEAYHFQDKTIKIFNKQECEFGYRESVFKKKYKDRFVIISVTYQLRKKPKYHISYGAIEKELEKMKVKNLSIQNISQAVINIRSSKLPDPEKIGNAGSFFKNPVVTQDQLFFLQKKYPDIPFYQLNEKAKIPAAWLMEQCGWKGYRKNNIGCNPLQPLVLVNYGNATGKEILDVSEEIIQSVKNKFDIELKQEVNIF